MEEMNGKVALVTGASRGIGLACAKKLANEGFTVIVNYNGNSKAASEAVEFIKNKGGMAEAYQCNVSNHLDVKNMIDEIIHKYGHLDVVVNNAGITKDNLLLKMTEEEFDAVINTNLKGVFNTAKYALRYMLKQKSGRVINLSSVVGMRGNVGQVNYAAAKAGVIGLTKSLAKEYASRNITVNAVAPGFIETDMTSAMGEKAKNLIKDEIPLKRLGSPEDIADMVSYLATNKGNYITGQVFVVDGGMTM